MHLAFYAFIQSSFCLIFVILRPPLEVTFVRLLRTTDLYLESVTLASLSPSMFETYNNKLSLCGLKSSDVKLIFPTYSYLTDSSDYKSQ